MLPGLLRFVLTGLSFAGRAEHIEHVVVCGANDMCAINVSPKTAEDQLKLMRQTRSCPRKVQSIYCNIWIG